MHGPETPLGGAGKEEIVVVSSYDKTYPYDEKKT